MKLDRERWARAAEDAIRAIATDGLPQTAEAIVLLGMVRCGADAEVYRVEDPQILDLVCQAALLPLDFWMRLEGLAIAQLPEEVRGRMRIICDQAFARFGWSVRRRELAVVRHLLGLLSALGRGDLRLEVVA